MSIIRYNPGPSHPFFVYDPNGDGISFWQSEAERDQAAKEAIQGYLNDGEWNEDPHVITGVVTLTHKTEAVNIQHPVGEIDQEGYDEDGEYWPDPDARKCDYALVPLQQPLAEAQSARYEFSILGADGWEQAGGSAPTYEQALAEGRHHLSQWLQHGPHTLELRKVEVLPIAGSANECLSQKEHP